MEAEPHNQGYWVTPLTSSTGFWGFPVPCLSKSGLVSTQNFWDHSFQFLRDENILKPSPVEGLLWAH